MTFSCKMIPDQKTTLLLQTALLTGEMAKESWIRYLHEIGDFRTFLKKTNYVKRLLPLLYYSLRQADVSLDKRLHALLKTAYLSERTRYEYYLKACNEVLSYLLSIKYPFLVVKGIAISHLVYPEPILRHCHDLDILVGQRHIANIAEQLRMLGLSEQHDIRRPRMDLKFIHSSRLPVELHHNLFYLNYYSICKKAIWENQNNVVIGDHFLQTTSPEITILHTCIHASYCPSYRFLTWICDMYFMMKSWKPKWRRILDLADASHSTLPLLHIFQYLENELHVSIPKQFTAQLHERVAKASKLQKQVWKFSQQYGTLHNSLSYCFMCREARAVIVASVFPSKEYVSYLSEKSIMNAQIYKGWYLCKFMSYTIFILFPKRLFWFFRNSFLKVFKNSSQ